MLATRRRLETSTGEVEYLMIWFVRIRRALRLEGVEPYACFFMAMLDYVAFVLRFRTASELWGAGRKWFARFDKTWF